MTRGQSLEASHDNHDTAAAAETAGFDVFLTTDTNLKHQKNLQGRRISIAVIGAAQWRGWSRTLPWCERLTLQS